MKGSILLWALVLAAVAACGSDDDDDASGPTDALGGNAASGGADGATPAGGAATSDAQGGGSSSGEGGTASPGAITNTEEQWIMGSQVQIPLAQGAYAYGDGVSTFNLTSPDPNEICLAGLGADAGDANEFVNYGAVMGVLLAESIAGQLVFDAVEQGLVGASFTIADPPDNGIRVLVNMVDTTEYDYEVNPFAYAGGYEGDFKTAGTYTVYFREMLMPEWGIEELVGEPVDPTSLHSLLFQVVTDTDGETPFDFCVSDITWLTEDAGAG